MSSVPPFSSPLLRPSLKHEMDLSRVMDTDIPFLLLLSLHAHTPTLCTLCTLSTQFTTIPSYLSRNPTNIPLRSRRSPQYPRYRFTRSQSRGPLRYVRTQVLHQDRLHGCQANGTSPHIHIYNLSLFYICFFISLFGRLGCYTYNIYYTPVLNPPSACAFHIYI